MKTINEIKDEVAEKAGYKNWDLLMYTFTGFGAHVQPYNDEVAKLYAKEAIKKVAEEAHLTIGIHRYINEDDILNLIDKLK